jgi:hypothetical protein
MPSSTYTIFYNAILAEQQVTCSYHGHRRELCPHIIGLNKDGEEAVLGLQFGGRSSKGRLRPEGEWKCLRLANVGNAVARDGPWHEGGSHKSVQSCIADVHLDINIHVRKNRR